MNTGQQKNLLDNNQLQNEPLLHNERQGAVETLHSWRLRSVRGILRVLVVLGFFAMVDSVLSGLHETSLGYVISVVSVYILVALFAFLPQVPYRLQAIVLSLLFYVLGALTFWMTGVSSDAGVFLLVFSSLSLLFFGPGWGVAALALSILTSLGIGGLFHIGYLIVPMEELVMRNLGFNSWFSTTVVFLMMGVLLFYAQNSLFRKLAHSLDKSQELTSALQESRADLETRVAERTADLERRANYLGATAVVAREAATVLDDPQELLNHTVNLISQQFGFYHAGIFLLDDPREDAILRAASSEGGQRMLARKHHLEVGSQSMVGFVTEYGAPRIALDVGEDAVYFDNPDLPETRSAMTLPLQAHDEIIGALDVQSLAASAFSDEDVEVLQVLADQVALAISNARLYQQSRAVAEAERRARGEFTREAWRDLLSLNPNMGFVSDVRGTFALTGGEWDKEMQLAVQTGQPTMGQAEHNALAIPIYSRGRVIGVIDAHLSEDGDSWSDERTSLLQALAGQLGTALESAQLYHETQRRATREQLTRQITDALQRAMSIETLMRIATEELNQNLGGSRAYVRLDVERLETMSREQMNEGARADAS